jgi:DNA-binding NtrC family response regulator
MPELRVHRFRVEVVDGPDRGKVVESSVGDACERDYGIGSALGNELILRDGSVSRHHCTIVQRPHHFWLRDSGSRNGTYLDNIRIESARLHDNAQIRVGVTVLKFTVLKDLVTHPLSDVPRLGDLVGVSPRMRQLFAMLPRIAQSDATVLILGETGTGKSRLAEAIHGAGPRASEPFQVIDCTAIPQNLLESELFGHERGAFTGAEGPKEGAFEAAGAGTVLLEEIGELSSDLQPKLLRAIEDRAIRRVGSTAWRKLNCRVLAATNRDLRQEVNRGAFRSDLFYRLNTVTLRLPPLRERPEDIPLLMRTFAAEYAEDGVELLGPTIIDEWQKRDWPGNVRELRNAVERVILLGARHHQNYSDAVPPPPSSQPSRAQLREALMSGEDMRPFRIAKENVVNDFERAYVRMLLERHGGNLSRAAREACMDRGYLRELARKHRLM